MEAGAELATERLLLRRWRPADREPFAVGFGQAGLGEIVSMTAVENRRSRAVMERLGMRRDPADDFEHPNVPPGSPLRPHVLYRIRPPGG